MGERSEGSAAGRVYVVTGATSGIGKEIARALVHDGATVIIPARDRARGEAVRADIGGGERVVVIEADLSSQRAVRAFSATVCSRYDRLDGLINNAGMWRTTPSTTVDGIEEIWATNVLAPYLMTCLLHDPLARGHGRVINTVSGFKSGLDLDDVEMKRRGFKPVRAYAQSKQALRWLTWCFADRWQADGIMVNAFDPGLVKTDLNRSAHGAFATLSNVMVKLFGATPARAAETASWLASTPEVAGVTHKLWAKRHEVQDTTPEPQRLEALWAVCEQMTHAGADVASA